MTLILIHRYRSYAIRKESTSIASYNLCKSVPSLGDKYPLGHIICHRRHLNFYFMKRQAVPKRSGFGTICIGQKNCKNSCSLLASEYYIFATDNTNKEKKGYEKRKKDHCTLLAH